MADNSAKVAKTTRILAIIHIIVGFLLICFGIADRFVECLHFWTGHGYYGISIGVWMCITGGLGCRNACARVFLGFSIMSTIFSGLIASAYSISINEAREIRQRDSFDYLNYDAEMAIASVILALCIVAFVIGIWSGCCLMTCCGCCATPEQVNTGHVHVKQQVGS